MDKTSARESDEMPLLPTVALCIQEDVKADFLPPDIRERFQGMPVRILEIDPEQSWRTDPAFFVRERPRVLITGWGAPPLPALREEMPGLEYVCHMAGSVRGLVPRKLLEQGLLVSNWGTAHAATVAECALMLALCGLRRVVESNLVMHVDRQWMWPNQCRPLSLYRRRVGLHGIGAVARALLPLLRAFDCEVAAYSADVPPEVFEAAGVKRFDSLEELFAWSGVLMECEAASPQNRNTVREEHFRLLPEDAVFVNVGRAAVVDEAGMLRVAREGRIQFGLDVYQAEPLPEDSPLRGLRTVTLLGHQAGPTLDRRRDCGDIALENLERFLRGESPFNLISPEMYDRAT